MTNKYSDSPAKNVIPEKSPKKTVIVGNKGALNELFGGDLKRDLEMESIRQDVRNNEQILMKKIEECMSSWNLLDRELAEKILESENIIQGKKRNNRGLLNQQSAYISPRFYNEKKTPTPGINDPNVKMIDNFKTKRQQLTSSNLTSTPKGDRNIQTLRKQYGITEQSPVSNITKEDQDTQLLTIIKILKQLVEKFISPIEGVNLKKVTDKKGKTILIFSSKTTDEWLNQYKIEPTTKKAFISRLETLESIKPFKLSSATEKIVAEQGESFWSLKLAKKYKIKKIPFNCFDMSLEEIMVQQQKLRISCPIPIILYHLTYVLVITGGLFAKEVFRISPSSNDLDTVINQISKGNYDIQLSKSTTAPYIPANCIKQLFSSMNKKKPILEDDVCEVPEGVSLKDHVKNVFKNLSVDKQNLFKFLAAISRKVVHNFQDTKINFSAIAMLFSPTVFPEMNFTDPNQIQKELKRNEKKLAFLEALLQNVPLV
eukprot:TRINITY_DN4694_c0_g1_i1.p1 TRINITY_DN4694_c0_g1~~TRINITY_DN4694_c0_g1_i1.p1  ORF type:complete len:486 (-),score=165.38 TRINITY_DN4694_c0_g1_i1:45-1502(-)